MPNIELIAMVEGQQLVICSSASPEHFLFHKWGTHCLLGLASMHECCQAAGLLMYLHTFCSLDVGRLAAG